MPNIDAAHITLTVAKQVKNALHIGPILLGTQWPTHILTPSLTARGLSNMTAIALLEANRNLQQ